MREHSRGEGAEAEMSGETPDSEQMNKLIVERQASNVHLHSILEELK